MPGYYERRRSHAARWCQKLALVCLPYFGLAILLHRFGKVTTPEVFWLIAFGLLMLVSSLALGLRALFDIWNRGDEGGGAAIRGIVLSLAMMLPFVWYGRLAVEHPAINDVSTNAGTPPPFVEVARIRDEGRAVGMNSLITYNDVYADLLISAYPKVGSRRYNSGAARIYTAVRALIAKRHWNVLAVRGLPVADTPAAAPGEAGDEAGEDAEAAAGQPAGEEAPAETPLDPDAPLNIEIEAVASSLIFGYKSDVAIAIISEAESTLVDMRSASRYGRHDFGANAALIEKFLADLDAALIGIAGEG